MRLVGMEIQEAVMSQKRNVMDFEPVEITNVI